MKHVKNREDAEFETERQKLNRQKQRPKRQKQDPVDRKMAFDEREMDKYAPYEPASKSQKSASIKKLIAAAVICVLCGLVVFAYANKDKLSPEAIGNWFNYELLGKNRGEGFPVYINGTELEYGNIGMLDGKYICYVSGTASVALGTQGQELYTRRISYTKPVMNNSGSYSLVYNLDGTGYQLSTASDILLDGNAEREIFYGAVNKNGDFALLTKADGYLSKLSVYDKNGNIKYTYSFSEYYAYCVDINSNATQAVVSTISTKNGEEVSALYLLDFSELEPRAITPFDNSTVYSVKYLSDGTAAVVCDDSYSVYNTKQGTFTKSSYGDRLLSNYCINTDTGCTALTLSRSGDGRMCDIDYYNSLGELETSIQTELKITSVDIYKDKIAVLSDGSIYEFDKKGNQLFEEKIGSDSKAIKLISGNAAYVVGISEIRLFDFDAVRDSSNSSSVGDTNGT